MRDLQAFLKASHFWLGTSNQIKHDKHRSLSSLACKMSAITVCCITLFTKRPRKFSIELRFCLVWNVLIYWLSEMEQKIRLSIKGLLWREVLSVDSWLLAKLSFCAKINPLVLEMPLELTFWVDSIYVLINCNYKGEKEQDRALLRYLRRDSFPLCKPVI